MKKYLLLLLAFFVFEIAISSILGSHLPNDVLFEQWFLTFIFLEIPIYGTLIIYEIRKGKGDDKK